RARCPACQVRYLVEPARRTLFRICIARLASSRRVSSVGGRGAGMSEFPQDALLRLAPRRRLNPGGGPEGLPLNPEGGMGLKGSARTIVELCDGQRTVPQVVAELQRRFPSEDLVRIETEALMLLKRLRDRGVLEQV